MTESSDEIIAALVQLGASDEFGEIIERYEEKLRRYARRFLNRQEDIDDLVQDVFIKSYTNIQSFDTTQKFSSWIYRIAHNTFVNELRRKERKSFGVFSLDLLLPQLAAHETADRAVLHTELEIEMEKSLNKLPSKYREPLVLFYYEQLSYLQISEVLQIPITTVGVRINRGRKKLKEVYTETETKYE